MQPLRSRNRPRGRALAAALLGLLAACSSTPEEARLEPVTWSGVERIHRFGDVYLASQPSAVGLEVAAARGVRTVADQRLDAETPEFDERATVVGLGMAYANPGFQGPDQLTDAVLAANLGVLRNAERPLLMHCASANRTGAIWLAHRVLDDRLPFETAVLEARQVGLRSPAYEARVRDYVERQSPDLAPR